MYSEANGFRPHWELLEMIGAVEFEAGVEAVSFPFTVCSAPDSLFQHINR